MPCLRCRGALMRARALVILAVLTCANVPSCQAETDGAVAIIVTSTQREYLSRDTKKWTRSCVPSR